MIKLTPAAHAKVAELLAGDTGAMFRVGVRDGGCAGNQYSFSTDNKQTPNDTVIDLVDFAVIINEPDLEKVEDSTIDFISDSQGSYFSVDNPNTTLTCSCGGSFSL